MKKIIIVLGLFLFVFGITGCRDKTAINKDNIAPSFLELENGYLPSMRIRKGEELDILSRIEVVDNLEGEVKLEILDDGGFNPNLPGLYILSICAKDEAGNKTIANLKINVLNSMVNTYNALIVNDQRIEYVFNNDLALNYTSSGTAFRSQDHIQVMDKDFFIELFNEKKTQHNNNGKIPLVINGVVILLDKDYKPQHVRIASETIEINSNGEAKNVDLNWNNTIDATNGGGNFKHITEAIEKYIPSGGYVVFTGAPGEQISKKFLIKNMFYTEYQGGAIRMDSMNVDYENLNIKLIEKYEEEIPVLEEKDEFGVLLVKDQYLDGIPLTTYYLNDGIKKPVIFFFHGFGSNRKDGIMGRGEELAKRGFFVVALDAYLHGERQPNYFANLTNAQKQQEIVNIQIQTAKDAKMLFLKYFKFHKYVDNKEVFAYGVSMGAGSAFYIGTIMKEVSTIISIVGSPSFYEFYKEKTKTYHWIIDSYYQTNLDYYYTVDPLINYDLLENKNIFMGNGSQDTVVPAKFAQELAEKINQPNLEYKLYNVAHSSTVAMLNDAYTFLENIKNK